MENRSTRTATLRTMQIIFVVLIVGLLTLSGLAIGLNLTRPPELAQQAPQTLLLALVFLAISELPAYFFIRRGALAKLQQAGDSGRARDREEQKMNAFRVYTALAFIAAAMTEGFGIFGGVVFLVSGMWPVLAAPALGILLLVLQIPTQGKFDQFNSTAEGYWR